MAKKFSELRAKMSPASRAEALRQAKTMLAESVALQTAEFFAQRSGVAEQGDLVQLLLQVKAREPLAGDEMPR